MSDFPGDDLLAEIAKLWAQITERDDAIAELRAQVAERDATILSLRALRAERDAFIAQVTKTLGGYPDSDLLSLATTVAAGYERWCNGHDAQVDSLRAQVAKRDATIAELRARDALPTLSDADYAILSQLQSEVDDAEIEYQAYKKAATLQGNAFFNIVDWREWKDAGCPVDKLQSESCD